VENDMPEVKRKLKNKPNENRPAEGSQVRGGHYPKRRERREGGKAWSVFVLV
jgi:hypothetical protein